MKRAISLGVMTAFAALTSLASAQPGTYYAQPDPYYSHRGNVYAYGDAGPDHDWYREHRHVDCRAPRWDPNHRYMPGQAVWRNGKLYVATDVSANVYNVNSPPEWTPNYWVQARCR